MPKAPKAKTIDCPECGHQLNDVRDSRAWSKRIGNSEEPCQGVKRRRVCCSCETTFNTLEIRQDVLLERPELGLQAEKKMEDMEKQVQRALAAIEKARHYLSDEDS